MRNKPDKLMEQLVKIAENMKACGDYFDSFRFSSVSELKIFSNKMKEYESNGDTLVHELSVDLTHAFITQIDQEDILTLAEQMDEVLDNMEECAGYFYMYAFTSEDEFVSDFRENIALCTAELLTAVQLLVSKNLAEIKPHTVNVKSYEGICDTIERKAIHRLFKKYSDPIHIIQMKDIYELLENTADACQVLAKYLDSIVMNNL